MAFAQAADGTLIHYRRFDPGASTARSSPVLVAVAPLGMTARLWEIAVPSVLARGYSVIAIDNRGSGRSGSPARPWSVRTMADDAIEVLDRERVDRAHICGPSLGGMIVQEIALRHPHRIGALVLAATTGGWPRIDLMPIRIIPRLFRELVLPTTRGGSRQERVRRFLRVSVSSQLADAIGPDEPLWRHVEVLLDEPVPAGGRLRQVMAGALHSTWSRLGTSAHRPWCSTAQLTR